MRILMLSHGYPPTISGVTLVVQKFAVQLVTRGHTVTVVTASETRQPYRCADHGVQVIRLKALPNPYWQEGPMAITSLKSLRSLILEFQPDLIHSHDDAWLGIQFLRLRNAIPALCIFSSYVFPSFVANYIKLGERLGSFLENLTWRYCLAHLNRYDHDIFSTKIQQQQYISHGLTTPSSVISNGVDLERYKPADGSEVEVERRYDLPPRPRLLFNGRLAADKRIDVLIRAMPHMWEQRSVHLLIAGRGDLLERLQALVAELQVEHCVHFLGFVPENDLPAIYRLSDIFAIASECEVQSIPALKALASGLPVVAAAAGALPEIVIDGQNGCLVPPDDPAALAEAVVHTLDGPLESFSQASLALSKAHGDQASIDALESLYRQLLDQRAGTRKMNLVN